MRKKEEMPDYLIFELIYISLHLGAKMINLIWSIIKND